MKSSPQIPHSPMFLLALLLVQGSAAPVRAAPETARFKPSFAIDVWENEDGLPENTVVALTQTQDGYLWLGTLNGLVRFDGTRFTVFDESNTPELPSSRIVRLFEDAQGYLWVGTETGGAVLVREGRITSLDIGRGSSEGRLMAACQDRDGAVWLYTADGQLCRYRAGRVDVWHVGAAQTSRYRALAAEPSGLVWVGSDWNLISIGPTAALPSAELPVQGTPAVGKLDYLLASRDGGHWRLAAARIQKWRGNQLQQDLGPYPWGVTNDVATACEDAEGNLIVGTLGAGLFLFNASGEYTHLTIEDGLSHNIILSLTVDREGSLWVGTDGAGLNRVRRQVFHVLPESRGGVVQTIAEDPAGAVWIGYNGGGIHVWDQGQVKRLGPEHGLGNLPVRAVLFDRTGQPWVGTLGGGVFRWRGKGFERVTFAGGLHPVVLALHEDRLGTIWAGTLGGLARWEGDSWKVFTTRDGLSADAVRAIADDEAGQLWIGTQHGGLNLFREGQFTSFRKHPQGLPSDAVTSIYADPEGILWVGTDGGGLAGWKDGRWSHATTLDGLVSNSLGYLLEDQDHYLWLGSNAGLMRVAKSELVASTPNPVTPLNCRTYRRSEGLPSSQCTLGSQPAACRTRDGRLWFPTIKGLASVHPSDLKPNPLPPPVKIESVLLEGVPQETNRLHVRWNQPIVVPPGGERLEIHYTSLSFAAPDRAAFRYRLEGYETAWTEAGNSRVARYPKLPPGDYRFHVIASNEDQVWNEVGQVLAIQVLPPIWQTWWFLATAGFTLLAGIIASVHYASTQRLQHQLARIQQQQALERERSRIARDLHDQLGASLTQIALLGELAETDKDLPHEVESHARQISQTSRETTRVLDEIVWAVNPANDTLDGLVTYLCKHAQEFFTVAGIRYRQEVPTHLPATPLPPDVRHNIFLAAMEAITNVVRHAKTEEARIRLRLDSGSFTLEIEDHGRGLADPDSKTPAGRNGLRNMRRRMEDIGGSFSLRPVPEGGTVVQLTAPLLPLRKPPTTGP